jgi:hypothetical protein
VRRYSSYSFTTSALDGVSGQRHAPATLYPRERTPGTHCTGSCVGPKAGMDTEVRGKILSPLPGIEPRSPGGPVRSQTLYCLSYPGSSNGSSISIYCCCSGCNILNVTQIIFLYLFLIQILCVITRRSNVKFTDAIFF